MIDNGTSIKLIEPSFKKSISPPPREMYYSVYSAVEEAVAVEEHLSALVGLALA